MYKEYKHNPPHLFLADTKYFITTSTLGRYKYLGTKEAKDAILHYLVKTINHFNWILEDWVILDNHLHLMMTAPEDATNLPELMHNITRFSANWLSKHGVKKIERQYFHNYWDTCITYERSYYCRLNYIWNNPVKHGYVEYPEDWEYGSYFYRIRELENDTHKIMNNYPIDRIHVEDDF